ncbi:DUF5689 domain-containing protein [Sphingobacterium sp. Mn56C]|uniref:DUF5689 domain-containing protein n=1 Tax=Sphingobacterium sp. Mn56C TaxID=3395261 RepID=UPI003BC476AC
MKRIYNTINFSFILSLLCLGLLIFNSSCDREYDGPPLTEPKYNGPSANITLADLKKKFADIKTPTEITEDLIIKAVVAGNDVSGNIYKQLYIQDETAGFNIGIDQNSMYTKYRVGQELYIALKGLAIVKYGDELQIAFVGTNANRIPWVNFNNHASISGWPNEANAQPIEVDLTKLDASMVNRLVMIKDVRFINEGKNNFTTGDVTTNEKIKDAKNTTLDVRTSNFSTIAKDKLPVGKGTLVGMLGRFNGGWQLFLRDKSDIRNFDGIPENTTPTEPGEEIIFKETLGTKTYASGNRPKIADFTDFDMKAPVVFTDASGALDIRSLAGDNGAHIWYPSNRDVNLVISGINTANAEGLTLSYQLAANLFNSSDAIDLNVLKVKVNGVSYAIPSTPVTNAAGDNSKFYTFTIPNIAKAATTTVEFSVAGTDNTLGLRLDNIIIKKGGTTGGNIIVVKKD